MADRESKWVVINGCLVLDRVACSWSLRGSPNRRHTDRKPEPLTVNEVDKLLGPHPEAPIESRIAIKNQLLGRGLMEFGPVRPDERSLLRDWFLVGK